MKTRATIINPVENQGKFYRTSIKELLENLDQIWRGCKIYENGIKVSYRDYEYGPGSDPEDGMNYSSWKANLYIFKDGEIYYVNNGEYHVEEDVRHPKYDHTTDFSDFSELTDKLDERLGMSTLEMQRNVDSEEELKPMPLGTFIKKYVEVTKNAKTALMESKGQILIAKVKDSIRKNEYTERNFEIDTKVKTVYPNKKQEIENEQSEKVSLGKGELFVPQLEWCRKAKYNVQIERACYKIDENHPLLEGFEEKTFNDGIYAVKSGTNELEQNSWTTNPDRPYVITGTVGERWPVKPSNISAYDVNEEDITIEPLTISTKDPSDQEFLVACHIPLDKKIKVISKWAYKDDGSIDESQVLVSNAEDSKISHADGDYIVAKHIDGMPEYMQLPEEQRNTKEAATLYSPRIINGSVMATTYDHAFTQEEIKNKYKTGLSI